MFKIITTIILLVVFCYSQDSTAIQLQIDKQIELGNTIQDKIIQGQTDLGKVEYAIFVLNEMLKPMEDKDEKDIN